MGEKWLVLQLSKDRSLVLKPVLLATNTEFPIRRKHTFLFLLILTVHMRCSVCI